MTTAEFQEIAHSGGKITFTIATDARGMSYQQSFQGTRPVPMAMISIYALVQGVPVCRLNMGGIGSPIDSPPIPGCFMVMICSDSEGKFGHDCRACGGYWRGDARPRLCPYCRHQEGDSVHFLSKAQRRYVTMYCAALNSAISSGEDGDYIIDMDEVADNAGKEGEKPPFYVSEVSQQHKFDCEACGRFNDVLGRFAYCSACGTRNDVVVFRQQMTTLRARVATDNIVRDAISAFDSVVSQYVKQLQRFIPLSARRTGLLQRSFHDLDATSEALKECFDLDLLNGMEKRKLFLTKMFRRRHIYEHNGGEVDQNYLDKSGDTTVKLKQHLSETVADMHQLLGDLDRMMRAMHEGFHALLPPIPEPIAEHSDRLARRKAAGAGVTR